MVTSARTEPLAVHIHQQGRERSALGVLGVLLSLALGGAAVYLAVFIVPQFISRLLQDALK